MSHIYLNQIAPEHPQTLIMWYEFWFDCHPVIALPGWWLQIAHVAVHYYALGFPIFYQPLYFYAYSVLIHSRFILLHLYLCCVLLTLYNHCFQPRNSSLNRLTNWVNSVVMLYSLQKVFLAGGSNFQHYRLCHPNPIYLCVFWLLCQGPVIQSLHAC